MHSEYVLRLAGTCIQTCTMNTGHHIHVGMLVTAWDVNFTQNPKLELLHMHEQISLSGHAQALIRELPFYNPLLKNRNGSAWISTLNL